MLGFRHRLVWRETRSKRQAHMETCKHIRLLLPPPAKQSCFSYALSCSVVSIVLFFMCEHEQSMWEHEQSMWEKGGECSDLDSELLDLLGLVCQPGVPACLLSCTPSLFLPFQLPYPPLLQRLHCCRMLSLCCLQSSAGMQVLCCSYSSSNSISCRNRLSSCLITHKFACNACRWRNALQMWGPT